MGAPHRVLYLSTSGQVGGAERCLLSLLGGLDEAEFAPAVLAGSEGGLMDLLERQHVPAKVVPLPAALRRLSRYHDGGPGEGRMSALREMPGYLRRLYHTGAEWQPKLVHSNGIKMHYASALLGRAWGAPLVWHLHDFPVRSSSRNETWSNRVLAALSGAPRAAVANSRAVAAEWSDAFPRLADKMQIVPNGVDVAAFQAARLGSEPAALRQRWGFGSQDCVIGMIAIFAPWKGQEIFLRAARQVHAAAPDIKFVLVGDDIYDTRGHGARREQLQALTQDLGLSDAVRFAGYLHDSLPAAYAALDVMVHASTEPEPFGRTAIEAMAAGVAVIGAAAGGMREVLDEGKCGWLTPPRDVAALAAAMRELALSPSLRRELAAAGSARVRQEYDQARISREMELVYRRLLKERRT